MLPVDRISVIAITKNGVKIASRLKGTPGCRIYAPAKLDTGDAGIRWYQEPTSAKIGSLFEAGGALVCLFSLGAVIRLIAPHMKSKKTDPAVIVIDDGANFVISVLSGHIGGANRLTVDLAGKLGATAVITTAADVNRTVAVDMVGREFGWEIEDDSTVTRVSAMMVNAEKIGLLQEAGEMNWWSGPLPENITRYSDMEELAGSGSMGHLIISDVALESVPENSVIYRPKTLVVGVGLHGDTSKEKIRAGIQESLDRFGLYPGSVARIASIRKPEDVQGLVQFGQESGIPIEYIDREDLAQVNTPNPSRVVSAFEGTPSVSEAAAILASGGGLVVEKQKFPPDLTVAVARIEH